MLPSRLAPADPPVMMTLAQAKALLGVPSGNTTFDVQIQFAIDVVSGMLRDYTSRYLMLDTYQDEFVGDLARTRDGVFLSLWEFPIKEVISFTVDGIAQTPYYRTRRDFGIILPRGIGCYASVVVEYEAGYTTLPAGLASVFLDLVRRQLAALGADISTVSTSTSSASPVRAVSIGQLRVEYSLTPSVVSSTVLSPLSAMVLEEYEAALYMYRHPAQHAATPA